MIIKKIEYTPYQIPLYKNFHNSRHTYSLSKGIIIQFIASEINSSKIIISHGDVSPLDNFSKENIQEIDWGIQSFIAGIDFDSDYTFNEILNLIKIHCSDLPSLHFALDTALYDLHGQIQKLSIAKILNLDSADSIKLSDLYIPDSNVKSNSDCIIKYKLGTMHIDDDIQVINSMARENTNILFRFDANQAFNEKEFGLIIKKLKHFNIDYFEEPIKTPSSKSFSQILNQFDINIAIDESLYNGSNYMNWIKQNLIHTVIIKPSIYGGYKKFLDFCQVCNDKNINIVLSSSLETGIGNLATIHLAASLNNDLSHGLNIHHFFNEFPYLPPYSNNASVVNIKNLIGLGL